MVFNKVSRCRFPVDQLSSFHVNSLSSIQFVFLSIFKTFFARYCMLRTLQCKSVALATCLVVCMEMGESCASVQGPRACSVFKQAVAAQWGLVQGRPRPGAFVSNPNLFSCIACFFLLLEFCGSLWKRRVAHSVYCRSTGHHHDHHNGIAYGLSVISSNHCSCSCRRLHCWKKDILHCGTRNGCRLCLALYGREENTHGQIQTGRRSRLPHVV